MTADDHGVLNGLRILVVEDEAMLAMALELTLDNLGCDVVAVASSVRDAVALAARISADCAILDVNLGGEKVYPVADILATRGIPFVFATGYGSSGLRDCDKGRPVLKKPFHPDALVKIVREWLPRREG